MCNCRKKEGFVLAMSKALRFEKTTGKTAAIFSIGETISFTDKENISKIKDICCYYTTDNVEHKVVKKRLPKVEKNDTRSKKETFHKDATKKRN